MNFLTQKSLSWDSPRTCISLAPPIRGERTMFDLTLGLSLLKVEPHTYLCLFWVGEIFPLMNLHYCHLNQICIFERGELDFSSPALNLWTSHGASNCIANKTQKCTHKVREIQGWVGLVANKMHAEQPAHTSAMLGVCSVRPGPSRHFPLLPRQPPHQSPHLRSWVLPYFVPPGLLFT